MNIKKGCVLLRAIEERDFEILLRMLHSPEIEKAIGDFCLPVSEIQHKEWIKNYRNTEKQIRWMIELENGAVIGVIMLYGIDMKNGIAEVGYKTMTDKEKRMMGDVDCAMQGVLDYAFLELRLNCIFAQVVEYNSPSERYLLRNGFIKEGVLRQRVYQSGKYVDIKVFSILKDEYVNKR